MRTRSEGVRRLSLLLGLAGGLLGCIGSFVLWEDVARKKRAAEAASIKEQFLALSLERKATTEDLIEGPEAEDLGRLRALRERIKAFNENEGVEYTPPKPLGFAEYLPIAVIPVAGFLIPWGGIRVIAWVIEGFLADRKRNRGKPLDRGAPP